MAEPNDANVAAMAELEALGLDVGAVHKVTKGIPAGSQLVWTDGGLFITIPGVAGAWCLADARKVSFR